MAGYLSNFVVISFLSSLLVLGIHGGAHIEINPERYSDIRPENVHISCRTEGLENEAKEIVMLQIEKKDDPPIPIAEIHQSAKSSFIEKHNYGVKGHIDQDVSLSYLNVTLYQTEQEFSGVYICKVFYVDANGSFKQDIAQKSFVVDATLEKIVKPLTGKIAYLEEKANLLENKTAALEKKAAFLQDMTMSLEKKAASLQNETSYLQEKADFFRDKTSVLEKTSVALENQTLSEHELSASLVEKLALLEEKTIEHEKEIRSLVEKGAMLDSDLAETSSKIESDISELADNISVDSIRDTIKSLEEVSKQEKSAINADKSTLSSLAKRVSALEDKERKDLAQIKSLAERESAIEEDLEKTNQDLSDEVNERLADKSNSNDTMNRVISLEEESQDQLSQIKTLASKQEAIKGDLVKTSEDLTQEVADRMNDKAAIDSINQKVSALEQMDEDHTKQIESLKKTDSELNGSVMLVEKSDETQTREIKSISSIFKDSVFPALRKLDTLQSLHGKLSKELKGLESDEIIIDSRIQELEEKHHTTTSKPSPATTSTHAPTQGHTSTTTTKSPHHEPVSEPSHRKPATKPPHHESKSTPSHHEVSSEESHEKPREETRKNSREESREKSHEKSREESGHGPRRKRKCHLWDFLCRIYG